jgi:hypothetical protein
MVSAFPLVAREWDPDNSGSPETMRAGASTKVGWICHKDPSHRWTASVNQRCSRLTGCGACGKAARSGRRPDQRHEVVEIAPLDWTPEDRF